MPLVSALIPTYNRAEYVGGAIETVLNQTYEDIEAVVVCDGSTDGTTRVLERYEDHDRVRIRYNDDNRGISYSFNRAAEVANGKYFCILGDDDRWHPDKVQRQVTKMETVSNEVGVIYTGGVVTDKSGTVRLHHQPRKRGDVYPDILAEFCLKPHSSHMISRHAFESVNGFDEAFPRGVDWEMSIRLAKQYRFEYLPDVLVRRISHTSNISEDSDKDLFGRLIWQKYRNEILEHPSIARQFIGRWFREQARRQLHDHRNWPAGVRSAANAFRYDWSYTSLQYLGVALTGPIGFDAATAIRRAVTNARTTRIYNHTDWTNW